MKYKWLHCNNNNKLIVFFNGWGMDESVVEHLNPTDFDIIMFYDYNTLDVDTERVCHYGEKRLIAWSMGVMTATLFNIDYKSKTAINGTLKPIDNKFGIPTKIYDLTLKNFSPEGAKKFIQNMFSEPRELPCIKREFENQKQELEALKNYQANDDFKYDRIIISDNDKVIPTKNQCAYWNLEPNVRSGHCPFYLFKNWEELL